MVTGSNSAADKQAVLDDAEAFGKREGSGAAARAGFYATLTEWSQAARIDVSDDQRMWEKFAHGAAQGASMIGGVKMSDNEDVKKVRVSECRQFIKLGSLNATYRDIDGVEVLDRAMVIIKQAKLDGTLKAKATDAMINVARYQNTNTGGPLEDDVIETVIQPKEGKEKVEADALEPLKNNLEKVMKKFGESDEIQDAIAYVQKRIDDLGGTTAYQKAQKALAKKAAKGFKV